MVYQKDGLTKTNMNSTELKIGEIIFHRDVDEHKTPLTLCDMVDDDIFVSCIVNNKLTTKWLSKKGTSRVYNHTFKQKARQQAITIETLAIPCADSKDNTFRAMMDMTNVVLILTSDVELNPEF